MLPLDEQQILTVKGKAKIIIEKIYIISVLVTKILHLEIA